MKVRREMDITLTGNGEIRHIVLRVKIADEVSIRGNQITISEDLAETIWEPECKDNLTKVIEETFSDLEKRTAELLNKRKKMYIDIESIAQMYDAEINLRYESEYDC